MSSTENDSLPSFKAFERLMEAEKLSPQAIRAFRYYYGLLASGSTGLITEQEIEPVDNLAALEGLSAYENTGQAALSAALMIKLNGGLGTSMGLDQAKSLLKAKESHSFLDIILKQVVNLREESRCEFPLLFMNSFRTERDTLEVIRRNTAFSEGQKEISASFLQNKVPKVLQEDLSPAAWPSDPELCWCPPGHGDIYVALSQTGLLDSLLERGFVYAFVSNADNLGAVMDLSLLGYFADSGSPFMMEVARRTEADKKGGHLARTASGGLTLRESAQCPEEEKEYFQDIERHRYFNTNSLWVNLQALKEALSAGDGFLKLPLIRNCKTLDPLDEGSPKVYQLETAMGAAISTFNQASAICVPRTRFTPVKKTDDLLSLWSDNFVLQNDGRVVPNSERRHGTITVKLDEEYYKKMADFEARFPFGAPSLIECTRFEVKGDVVFGRGVIARGSVSVVNEGTEQLQISDGTILEG